MAARGPCAGFHGVAYRTTIQAKDASVARMTASLGTVSRFIRLIHITWNEKTGHTSTGSFDATFRASASSAGILS